MNNTATLNKTDFIKFNVSSTFKSLVEKKAVREGMTISELGRMLFGAFLHGWLDKTPSAKFIKQAEKAKADYYKGKGKTFKTAEDAVAYLDKIS